MFKNFLTINILTHLPNGQKEIKITILKKCENTNLKYKN